MLALLFPGQGSQEVGMGRDVFLASTAARETFAVADDVLGFPLSRLCFEGPEEELLRTEVQQPAILTTCVALLRALEERTPVTPAYVAGHSLGEYAALVASGSLAFEDAVRIVHARGRFMQEGAHPTGENAADLYERPRYRVLLVACVEGLFQTSYGRIWDVAHGTTTHRIGLFCY